jgi:hypothetical protein
VRLATGHRTDTADVALTSTSVVTAYRRPAVALFTVHSVRYLQAAPHIHGRNYNKKQFSLHIPVNIKYGTK